MPTRIAADAEPIPGYRLIERLGRGGFGEVWKAQAPGGMFKAIKFVYGNLDEATENGKPAEQELKALNRVKTIRHPYILTLERFDIVEGQLIIVMELADRNLFDRFRECQNQGHTGIPREELLEYIDESAEALDLMNGQFQLQHLDIKPQNIFLVFNHIKVADFGLAKDLEGMQATLTGGVTPVYAAPETFECRVTRFCDQYSLAIVYQEMLTGQRPFNGTTARQLMMQHIQSPPDLTPLPAHDRAIIGRALSKKPDERFPTCSEMIQALRAAGSSTIVAKREPVAVGRTSSPDFQIAPPATALINSPFGGSLSGLSLKDNAAALPALDRSKLPSLQGNRPSAVNAVLAKARAVPPERTGPGVLFPALVIGLGQFGLLALQRLRRAVRDRFSSSSLPNLRMLYLDTEGETLQSISSSSAALDPGEVFLAKLNRPSHYAKPRADFPDVSAWLNPQMLYRLPRQPATTGVRAFGRLALCDHYRAIAGKIRADIDACTSAEALDESASKTGLELRTNRPRVYIITSLMGGSGGGMFLDLAYIARLQLKLLGYKQPEVQGLLFAPQAGRDSPRTLPVANAYAAVTELLHYNAPGSTYEALFDTKEGPIADQDRPFQRCMILQLPGTSDPAALRPILGLAAGYIFQETLTPLGKAADKVRGECSPPGPATSSLQTFGTFRLGWPHKTLLELTARRCAEMLLRGWAGTEGAHLAEPIKGWLHEQWAARQLDPENMLARLRECNQAAGDPARACAELIDPLDNRTRHPTLEPDDFAAALERLTQLVGKPEAEGKNPTGGIADSLERASRELAGEVQRHAAEMTTTFTETPGYRLPGAEEVLNQISARLKPIVDQYERHVAKLQAESREGFVKVCTLGTSLESMSRGGRRAAVARDALSLMRQYATKRLDLMLYRALAHVYRALTQYLPEAQRQLQVCRQRIEEAAQRLAERRRVRDAGGTFGPERPLLPPGCLDLLAAADQTAASLNATDMLDLDNAMQAQILRQYQSLMSYCQEGTQPARGLAELAMTGAREFLAPRMGNHDAAAVFFANHTQEQSAFSEVAQAFNEAVPELAASRQQLDQQLCLLSVPASEHGERLTAIAQQLLPDARLATLAGSDEIIFHREQQNLGPQDLPQVGPQAREAFVQFTNADQAAPHTRSDVRWQPVVGRE